MKIASILVATLAAPVCGQPTLTALDFQCFLNRAAKNHPYAANFDGHPTLTANDFQSFIDAYASNSPTANCDASGGNGWTNLSLPPGAIQFYVAANGSDTNPGTLILPFHTVARGIQALRDGNPDQLLLHAGDTFTINDQINLTKSARSTTQYMVIGSYGPAGPRPKIRTNGGQGFFGNVTSTHSGLAIVGLDIQPGTIGSNQTSGILFFEDWNHILIEDCYIANFAVNIVIQGIEEFGQPHLDDVKIRRNIIVDSNNTGSGHTQGIYVARTDSLLVEGNTFDRNGWNNNTMFSHNVYIHESCGLNHVFRDNISARASSHGVQLRPGGLMENNLFLANPINAYHGDSAGPGNSTTRANRWNVCIDSGNINNIDQRGQGLVVGANGIFTEHNIVAYNAGGTGDGAVCGFILTSGMTFRGNYAFDWSMPGGGCGGVAAQWENDGGTVLSENNKFFQPRGGAVWRIPPFNPGGGTHRNNQYVIAPTCTNFAFAANKSPLDWNAWRAIAGESGSSYSATTPTDPHIRVGDYMTFIGASPATLDGFLAQCRNQSKANWNLNFISDTVNDFARKRAGVTPNP